eukprot:COSAG04_NODE_455_length_14087_cov_4.673935_6_plen_158_part_00
MHGAMRDREGMTQSVSPINLVSPTSPRARRAAEAGEPLSREDDNVVSLVFEADRWASRIKIAEEQLKAQMEQKIATLRAGFEQYVQEEVASLKAERRRELRQLAANAAAASNKRPRSPAAANDDERSIARARSDAPPMTPRSGAANRALSWFGPTLS